MSQRAYFESLESDKKLLVIILCDSSDNIPQIKMPNLTVQHAIAQAKQYKKENVAVIVVDGDGHFIDLNKASDDEVSVSKKSLSHDINNLKNASASLQLEAEYDKAIIIGKIGPISSKTTMMLKNFNEKHIKPNGLIRVQICNFKETKDQTGNNFVLQITPKNCKLSIPDNWSIISSKDTRAIDVEMTYDAFEYSKGGIKKLLTDSKSKSDEMLASQIDNFLNTQFSFEVTKSLKIILPNGSSKEFQIIPHKQNTITHNE